jgi:hypothetical protein
VTSTPLLAIGCVASLACGSPARQPPAVPVPVHAPVPIGAVLSSYRAPLGCPDEQQYISSVESRSQTLQVHSATAGEAADRLRVRIQPDTGSAGWIGALQIEGVHALEREVRGQRCEDVALALALIAVLRLDAKAPATPPPLAARAAGSASLVREAESAAGTLLTDSAVEIVRSQRPRRAAVEAEPRDLAEPPDLAERPDAREPPRRAVSSPWQPSVAAHLGYVSAPSQALQGRLRVELQLGPRLQSGSVALGFSYADARDRNASADLDFALLGAQLDVCPLALVGAALWLRGCASLSGGALAVSVRALDDDLVSQSSSRAWAALGPGIEAGIPLDSSWTARALAEGSFLLVRDRFEVERIVGDEAGQPSQITRTLLYRPPFGSFAVLLGLGYAF